jgi:quinol monooxygenase YgiN
MFHQNLVSRIFNTFFLFLTSFGLIAMTQAAENDATSSPALVVSYFDVNAGQAQKAAQILKELSASSSKEDGNLRFEAVQRIGHPDQFAILEAWKNQDSMLNHQKSESTLKIREKLSPLLRSSYDERPHSNLQVGEISTPIAQSKSGIFVITHVDIVPTVKDQGIALVKELTLNSQKDTGNIRFEALTQISRPNHMTVVEIWKDQQAISAHASKVTKREFREKLSPMSGSLYDERFFKLIN